jgi:hypothetical protein
MPLSTVLGEVKPTSVFKTPDGGFVYAFPKNFVGTVKFAPLPSAVAGSRLDVQLGEWLVPEKPVPAPAPAPLPKGSRCGLVAENTQLLLGCTGGKTIDKVVFASFGTPVLADGEACAGGFETGICSKTGKIGSSNNSLPVVEKFCLHKTSCTILADR